MSIPPAAESAIKPSGTILREVKYSLPEMLAELQFERGGGSFAMEKLDQVEIGKLFKPKAVRRVKSK